MEKRLDFKINVPQDVILINNVFKEEGLELFLVGGCVRDSYLELKPKDWDLVTNALPDKVIELLKNQPFVTNILETGKSFGVINVITENDEFEIATFREDGDYTDSRRPDGVVFSTIEKDVLRRDITINALFYNIEKKRIVDLVGGIADLNYGEIRTVGKPEDRFKEDPLRKLRCLRFAARFDFRLNSKTAEAINNDNSLTGVSPERIRDEFLKGIKTAKSSRTFLTLLFSYKMFDLMFPDFYIGFSNIIADRTPEIVMAVLFEGNNISFVKKALHELKYTSDEIGKVYFLMSFKNFEPEMVYNAKKSQLLSKLTNEEILRFAELTNMDIELVNKFLDFNLTVTGEDIEKLGIKPGPEMGRKIKELELENFLKILNK